MSLREKKIRYLVCRHADGVLLGGGASLQEIVDIVGCSLPTLYKSIDRSNDTFKFGGVVYKIIDKLDR